MSRKDEIAEEWDEAAESWLDFVRKGKDYYRDELNNPAAFKLIGNIEGQLVLDLACGEGYNTRILARKGARVTGVDMSEKQMQLAQKEEKKENLGICYFLLSASNLGKFPSKHFDLVTCFMSMQDIEDYEQAITEIARVLKERGRFVFSIPHPCFETMTINGKRVPATERYFGTVRYNVQWDMERLVKHFRTTSFHRTLTDYFDALYKNGLRVSRLVEPRPTRQGLRKHPPLKQVLSIPHSVIIESIKCKR